MRGRGRGRGRSHSNLSVGSEERLDFVSETEEDSRDQGEKLGKLEKLLRKKTFRQWVWPSLARHAGGVLGNYLYVFGGRGEALVGLGDLWQFDFRDKCWTLLNQFVKVPEGSMPELDSHTMDLYGSTFYIFGGFQSGSVMNYTNTMWSFNPKERSFSKVDPNGVSGERPHSRANHSSTIIGRKLAIFGGCYHGQKFNDLWL